MIASLNGIVKAATPNAVVVEVGGVGILVQISPRQSGGLVVGKMVSLHTTLLVREDSLTLFGFETIEERALFELLQTVTGIGPKVAQSALGVYEAQEIYHAIATENSSLLEKIPGLGKKGAARLVLELKDKVSGYSSSAITRKAAWRDQLQEALVGLGFSAKESADVLDAVQEQTHDASSQSMETLLKLALQLRGRRP